MYIHTGSDTKTVGQYDSETLRQFDSKYDSETLRQFDSKTVGQ